MTEKFVERIDAVFLPVKNLEESLAWYQSVFHFPLRWKNKRMAGLEIANNCGFHLVEVSDYEPSNQYTPFNFVVEDVEKVRDMLIERNVTVSDWRHGEPKRFDVKDTNNNLISVIQI
jgi:catechol 2,3-dioxygenase-like lactoylglutathione lyase family enzyme